MTIANPFMTIEQFQTHLNVFLVFDKLRYKIH